MEAAAADLEIRDLAARYCDAVNRRDEAAWRATWASDSEWQLMGITKSGRDEIVAFWLEVMGTIPFVLQLPSFGVIDFPRSPDPKSPDTATGRWYINELTNRPSKGTALTIGVYHDHYVHEENAWRFARRSFDVLYRGGESDLTGTFTPPPQAKES
jgi:hypothetical protein